MVLVLIVPYLISFARQNAHLFFGYLTVGATVERALCGTKFKKEWILIGHVQFLAKERILFGRALGVNNTRTPVPSITIRGA